MRVGFSPFTCHFSPFDVLNACSGQAFHVPPLLAPEFRLLELITGPLITDYFPMIRLRSLMRNV